MNKSCLLAVALMMPFIMLCCRSKEGTTRAVVQTDFQDSKSSLPSQRVAGTLLPDSYCFLGSKVCANPLRSDGPQVVEFTYGLDNALFPGGNAYVYLAMGHELLSRGDDAAWALVRFTNAGIAEPTDEKVIAARAKMCVPWPAKADRIGSEGSIWCVRLSRDYGRNPIPPSVESAWVIIDPTRAFVEVRHIPGK
jgi:hypothetical protein